MDHTLYIVLAYAFSGALIAGICVFTALRARAVKRQLEKHETL
jgi:heme exporter protein CcmD